MTRDEFTDIMGKIDEKLIEGALNAFQPEIVEVKYNKHSSVLRYAVKAAACFMILGAVLIGVPYLKKILPQRDDFSENAGGSTSISASAEYEFKRGWSPDKLVYDLVYNESEDYMYISDGDNFDTHIGENMIAYIAKLDGITAELILHNIKKEARTELVNEAAGFDYTEYIGAEDIVLYVHDDMGNRFIADDVTPHFYNDMELINVHCLFDGCTRLYKTDNSEYVLMQYADCNDGALIASFYGIDFNTQDNQICHDENGIYDASAWRVQIVGNKRIGSWKYGYQASKKFEYAGGKFRDVAYGYEMYWNESVKAIYPYYLPAYEEYEKFVIVDR